jgi:TIGR03009 family protein
MRPSPGFQLSPQDEAVVAMVLKKWEDHKDEIKTFSCKFTMWEYNNQLQLNPEAPEGPAQHQGYLSYAAPDKGMYQVEPDAQGQGGEHWICDGKSVYEVRHAPQKQIIERPLPANLQGKAIADAPLPFVFGSSAAKMQQRFWMRVSTPQHNLTKIELAEGQVLLEAIPKTQQDAANFQLVQIIFNEQDMTPFAINEFLPNHTPKNEHRLTYVFEKPSVNSPFEAIKNFFVNPTRKFGYKVIVEKPPAEQELPQRPEAPSANLRYRPAAPGPLRR